MPLRHWIWIMIGMAISLEACQPFENAITIDLEEEPSELVVECYLEPGAPVRLLLTETKHYFDPVNACPFVRNALVVITHQGQRDTLTEATYTSRACSSILPFFDQDSTRFYNYGSDKSYAYTTTEDFILEVWDTAGQRYVTAQTRFMPIVPIKTLEHGPFNADNWTGAVDPQTTVTLSCEDDTQTRNYYRFTLHKNALSKRDTSGGLFSKMAVNPTLDVVLFDQGVFNDGTIFQTSGFNFYNGDWAIGTIYHLDQAYHDYLVTSWAARDANINPFLQPAKVISNIQGGQGIFTALSYDRRRLLVLY